MKIENPERVFMNPNWQSLTILVINDLLVYQLNSNTVLCIVSIGITNHFVFVGYKAKFNASLRGLKNESINTIFILCPKL